MSKAACPEGLPQMREGECPVFYAIRLIGQKWKIPIIWKLAENSILHYNELKRQVPGITNTALTRCLRELESFGLVYRFEHGTIPPSVEYSLTDRGKALMPVLTELHRWGSELTVDLAMESTAESMDLVTQTSPAIILNDEYHEANTHQ